MLTGMLEICQYQVTETMQCGLTDIGCGRYVLSFNEAVMNVQISFVDLYQYDADGNLVATDQLDFMKRMEREQVHERIVLEKDYYTIISKCTI